MPGAVKWLEAMQSSGVPPNARSYSSVINACAQSGDVPGAVKWLEAMQSSGVPPNDRSYSSVINACAQSGDVPGPNKIGRTWLVCNKQDRVAGRGLCLVVQPTILLAKKTGSGSRSFAPYHNIQFKSPQFSPLYSQFCTELS